MKTHIPSLDSTSELKTISMLLSTDASQTLILKMLKSLVTCTDARFDASKQSDRVLRGVARKGFPEVVRVLLDDLRTDPVNPGVNNNFPIRIAAANGHLHVVRVLLRDRRVDPSADNQLAIKAASAKGHLEVVKVLEDPRVDFTVDNHYALRSAREHGH
ncbi:UNVERIFIED_CONTAM: hypothetical protein HDU68_001338 [Siphonaria sp. JEL0065]|nr:hypothetical protein HDU68_001338 [Siphonaria sp. JEL0065]